MLVEHDLSQYDVNGLAARSRVLPPWPLDEFLSKKGLVLSQCDDRRRYARLYYRQHATLLLETSLPAFVRPSERIHTFSCDLSRGGVAFLSRCELFPKERVTLRIAEIGNRQLQVVRCRRLATACYEIGATFVAV